MVEEKSKRVKKYAMLILFQNKLCSGSDRRIILVTYSCLFRSIKHNVKIQVKKKDGMGRDGVDLRDN